MKTSLIRRATLAALGTIALASAMSGAWAQDIKERNLKFAFSLAKDHPLGPVSYTHLTLPTKA